MQVDWRRVEVLDTRTFDRFWRLLQAEDVRVGDELWWQSLTGYLTRKDEFKDKNIGGCFPTDNPLLAKPKGGGK